MPKAHLRSRRLVDGTLLLLAVSCFASALFLAMAVTCAIPLYFSTYDNQWLSATLIRFSEPGEVNRWLRLVTVSALPGGLGLLVARRSRGTPRAPLSGSAFRFAVWGLFTDGLLTALLITVRICYPLLRG